MKKPKHVGVMEQIDQSAYASGRRRLPPSKWAEMMRAIAEDIENDDLDHDGKERVLMAIGRAAVEMDQNEKDLKVAKDELAKITGAPQGNKKEPKVKPEAAD